MTKPTKNKFKAFKDFFLIKKQEILDLNLKKANEVPVTLDVGDEMDIAQVITIEDMNNKLNQRNKAMLARINIALEKIEKNTFGCCESCEEDIYEARLKAIPDCRLCINCAEQEEKIRKQYRSA